MSSYNRAAVWKVGITFKIDQIKACFDLVNFESDANLSIAFPILSHRDYPNFTFMV